MEILIDNFGLFLSWLVAAIIIFIRYALFAGMAFLFFYQIKKQQYKPYKIQTQIPNKKKIKLEIKQSLGTALVFALVGILIYFMKKAGWTSIYTEISTYGWLYFIVSFFGLLLLHDTYFYWIHRLMHLPLLFPIFHRVHHLSYNPTPWAALSFHPLEAILEIAIIPIVVLFIPFHVLTLALFGVVALATNIIGHLGYELFPKWFIKHPLFRWFNTSTHHNMHHSKVTCNYGLYFNFWDYLMGTNHEAYEVTFEKNH